jgi:hypothetical protein
MGDSFQTIVDRDIPAAEAEPVASAVLQWLVERGYVERGQRDCILGKGGMGHPPGPNYRAIVELSKRHRDNTLKLRTNGLSIIRGRTVFDAGQGGLELVCRQCGSRIEGNNSWSKAIREWHEGKGGFLFSCPECGHVEPVSEWRYDPPWGFGDLGFQFWNWPPLKESFVNEMSARLGHRTVLVQGKL